MRLAFLGLGTMGAPMAGHLHRAGRETAVWNRTAAKAERWANDFGGNPQASLEDAVAGADIVFACLGDDGDVAAVAGKAAAAMKQGSVFVDHTTASPALARRLHRELGELRIAFVDAPVSGGEAGAKSGKLSVMCGGDADAIERARPAMAAYAAKIVHIGAPGSGQLCKAVNQICIAGLVQGLAEGVHFAGKAGLDLDRVLEAISGGAARSWQMENRAQTMAADEFDFGFAVDWMRKDLRIALTEARENGARLPVAALVDQFYADVQAMGGGRWDTSSLIRRLNDTD